MRHCQFFFVILQYSYLKFFILIVNRSMLADAQDERDKIIHENERLKARQHKMIEAAVKDA